MQYSFTGTELESMTDEQRRVTLAKKAGWTHLRVRHFDMNDDYCWATDTISGIVPEGHKESYEEPKQQWNNCMDEFPEPFDDSSIKPLPSLDDLCAQTGQKKVVWGIYAMSEYHPSIWRVFTTRQKARDFLAAEIRAEGACIGEWEVSEVEIDMEYS